VRLRDSRCDSSTRRVDRDRARSRVRFDWTWAPQPRCRFHADYPRLGIGSGCNRLNHGTRLACISMPTPGRGYLFLYRALRRPR
jgi:hypothetical protein